MTLGIVPSAASSPPRPVCTSSPARPTPQNLDDPPQPTRVAPIALTFPPQLLPVAVGPLLAEALDSRWQTYRAQLRHCQEHFSEEGIHQLRVATRRLLAQLTLLSNVALLPANEKARRILKRRLAALGDLRDAQVQRLFIEHHAVRFPELVLLRRWLQRRERRLALSAAEEVNHCKIVKLERWIAAMIDGLTARTQKPRVQSQLASSVWCAAAQTFAEAVERRKAIDLADLRTVHQTRVAFKRFRYTMESLSPGITGLSKRQLRALAYYQRKMGIIQDLEVMGLCLARYTREDPRREALLQRFNRHVRQRRGRALRSFLKSADRIYKFWPPATLAGLGESVVARDAA
jgi:CHAD domain-containing protein